MKIEPRKNIAAMKAYVPPLEGRRDGSALLLDFNERTIPPDPVVIKALQDFATNGALQVYPEYGPITKALAEFLSVEKEFLMLANGSDNAIDTIMRCYLEANDKILIPQPSFTMFAHSAHLQGAQIVSAAYTKESGYPIDEVKRILSAGDIRMCVICNPNNPTGTILDQKMIEDLVKNYPQTIFLIDEAYYEFLRESSISLALTSSNAILTRTFSKAMGLPALRFGYVVALPEIINELIKVRGPYAVNMMSVIAALTAIKNFSYVNQYVKEVMEVSKPQMEAYYREKNIPFWKSGSNFHLIEPPISDLAQKLTGEGIKIRPMSYPGFEGTVRISVGTTEDTKKILTALRKILG